MKLRNNVEPFLLKPVGKDNLWGGTRLKDDFGKELDVFPLAESWECSTHPAGESIVDSGVYKGKKLMDVLNEHPEYIGSHPKIVNNQIPVLVKFIDAAKDLSSQVHPTDEYARIHENGSWGKTEMWYIVDATKDAFIIYGFHHRVTKKQIRDAIASGTLEKYMNIIHVKPGEVYFIPSGTVHAIGKGCLIAEIQESSDLTYRLYDYNRIDKNGKTRELHIDKALDVANLESTIKPRQPLIVYKYKPGKTAQILARCEYFQVERIIVNTERIRSLVEFKTGSLTFQILLCYHGCGVIIDEQANSSIAFFKGDTIFVPSNSDNLKIHGKAEFLKIRC